MKTNILKILFAVILLSGSSCNLLDVKTVSSITGDDYWTSKGDAESYLMGIYTKLRDVSNATLHFEDRGDAFTTGLEGGPSNLWAQNLNAQNGYSWLDYYSVIHHCNLMIRNVEHIPFGIEAEKQTLLAETHLIRSMMYFNIVRVWGDAPIELEPTENANKPKLSRSPASDVLQQALTDVETAITLFPQEGYPNGKGRASMPAAYALKADILLWKAKVLNGGVKELEEVITLAGKASANLSLEESFGDLYATKKGKEVIFAIHFNIFEKEEHYSSRLKPRDVFVEKAVNKELIPFAKGGARSTYAPSEELMALLSEYATDQRRDHSYIRAIDGEGHLIGIFDNKMRGTKTEGDRSYDSDIILYRLAEMHLFKAEAFAALNRIPEAINELNIVRNRAGIGNYTGATDQISVEREILRERGRELYLERKRWPDLIRFHYGGTIDIYDEVPNLKAKREEGSIIPLYLAIPLRDLDLNPNLTQTEGYEDL